MVLYPNNQIVETYSVKNLSGKQPIDEIDSMYENILSNLKSDTKIPKDVLNSFQIKSELNPEIWNNGKLNPDVKIKLLKIANDFFKSLELPPVIKIKDVIFTGSLANFNWSKFSDIDVHIVVDFLEFGADELILSNFLHSEKMRWNNKHNVTIFNYPVELYVQDINAKLNATAVYSIVNDKWILKPEMTTFKLDIEALKAKAQKFVEQLKDIRKLYQENNYLSVIKKTEEIKNKIQQIRKSGLEIGGEFSLENILFKLLRRINFIDYLDDFKNKAYDKSMSLNENINPKMYTKGGELLILGPKLEDGTQRLYLTSVKGLSELPRLKKGDEDGQPAHMANLGNQVYRLSQQDGKLVPNGVAWKSEPEMLKTLNLKTRAVALNNNKTPMHWKTLYFNSVNQMLNQMKSEILMLPNIRWVG